MMDEDDNDDMMRHYAEWEAWAEQIDEGWDVELDENEMFITRSLANE